MANGRAGKLSYARVHRTTGNTHYTVWSLETLRDRVQVTPAVMYHVGIECQPCQAVTWLVSYSRYDVMTVSSSSSPCQVFSGATAADVRLHSPP